MGGKSIIREGKKEVVQPWSARPMKIQLRLMILHIFILVLDLQQQFIRTHLGACLVVEVQYWQRERPSVGHSAPYAEDGPEWRPGARVDLVIPKAGCIGAKSAEV
jgi:hypothetical protein